MCRTVLPWVFKWPSIELCPPDLLTSDFAHDGDTLTGNKRREPHVYIVARGAEGLAAHPFLG